MTVELLRSLAEHLLVGLLLLKLLELLLMLGDIDTITDII